MGLQQKLVWPEARGGDRQSEAGEAREAGGLGGGGGNVCADMTLIGHQI